MHEYQTAFIRYAIQCGVLQFGSFKLKSGRESPYFFNTGLFNSGSNLKEIGRFYAQAINQSKDKPDVLYGPAYKGIQLTTACGIALSELYNIDIPITFNRKEEKKHGEGSHLVGAPLQGNVLILDDVITAGTSVRESVEIIRQEGAKPCGVLIALDRQEKGIGSLSAVQETNQENNLEVSAIINLKQIILFLEQDRSYSKEIDKINKYRQIYGI